MHAILNTLTLANFLEENLLLQLLEPTIFGDKLQQFMPKILLFQMGNHCIIEHFLKEERRKQTQDELEWGFVD